RGLRGADRRADPRRIRSRVPVPALLPAGRAADLRRAVLRAVQSPVRDGAGGVADGALCLFSVVRTPRARVVWTLVVGVGVATVCVAPSMGADFGSMLATIPAFGLLALLVSGIRPRLW